MPILSQFWNRIQGTLFPALEDCLGPLSDSEQKLVAILELARIEEHLETAWGVLGRPEADRKALARAFVAKMVYNLGTTRQLRERLRSSPNLRRLCGWERANELPSEATFSRAFHEFAESELPQRVHAELLAKHQRPRLVGHLSRDATDIPAREKARSKQKRAQPKPKGKRGRPRRGETRPSKEPTRLQRQAAGMSLEAMVAELPRACDYGTKRKHGGLYRWKGYKLHVDWADGEIPVSAVLTSASLHDSQVALPLGLLSAARVTSLYDLADAAYDAPEIWAQSRALGHVPIIDRNPRRGEKIAFDPATQRRFAERSTAERGFSLFKENFGGRQVRVRGAAKVMAHLMFGLLALTAERLLNLLC